MTCFNAIIFLCLVNGVIGFDFEGAMLESGAFLDPPTQGLPMASSTAAPPMYSTTPPLAISGTTATGQAFESYSGVLIGMLVVGSLILVTVLLQLAVMVKFASLMTRQATKPRQLATEAEETVERESRSSCAGDFV